ncbi:MAG: pentapeptide repeat-containing protein [Myxococcota bacterium]
MNRVIDNDPSLLITEARHLLYAEPFALVPLIAVADQATGLVRDYLRQHPRGRHALTQSWRRALLSLLLERHAQWFREQPRHSPPKLRDVRRCSVRHTSLHGIQVQPGTRLRWIDLAFTHMPHSSWSECDLTDAQLDGIAWPGAQLSGADLSNSSLHKAQLDEAKLHGTSLMGASLRRASLRHAQLDYADLTGADLAGADLSNASLHNTYLGRTYAPEVLLMGADLRLADLAGAHLNRARLDGADLRGVDLRWTELRGASLNQTLTDVHTRLPEG